ncbi:DUF2603 domain-containing protein [Wolinella succinogenes]|uniref:DUF2603 domain-containing protein n=1 Tax=Wolinella succinogenes TaxID=844 RepID=UPI00240A0834|nr:DUF2603 domain-containing protein [Wolinella succinogenes]
MEKLVESLSSNQKRNQALLHPFEGNEALLELTKGRLGNEEPCHVKGAQGEEYVMLPKHLLLGLVNLLQKGREERVKLNLERDILQQMPIDFEDVWEVALQEIHRENANLSYVDTKRLIKEIKRRHPNLFFQLGDLFGRAKEEMLD